MTLILTQRLKEGIYNFIQEKFSKRCNQNFKNTTHVIEIIFFASSWVVPVQVPPLQSQPTAVPPFQFQPTHCLASHQHGENSD